MIPALINSSLRRAFPGIHRQLRRAARFLLIEHALPPLLCPSLPRKLDGERVWVHPRFFSTPLDVEPHVRHWLRQYLAPGKTFFDVGAYVGWHSIYAARQVGRDGKIIAFEASPANAFCLDFHRRKNNLSQMEVVAAAVADCNGGELVLHLLNGGDSTSNSIQCGEAYVSSQANQSVTDVTVPMTNLDSHSERHPPDLVKIDVEGAELLVLAGAAKLMSTRRPPIILAVHPTWLAGGEKPQAIIDLLHRRGYKIYEASGKIATELDFADYLCLPQEIAGRAK